MDWRTTVLEDTLSLRAEKYKKDVFQVKFKVYINPK